MLNRLLLTIFFSLSLPGIGFAQSIPPVQTTTLQLNSPQFAVGGPIADAYTCTGANMSPELNWNGVPDKTQSFALIVEDPDAPNGTYTHWLIYDIPTSLTGLPRGVAAATQSAPYRQGTNSFKQTRYDGPCPPAGGGMHHYHFHLYALDTLLKQPDGIDNATLRQAMTNHVLGQVDLMGTYEVK